MHVHVNVTVMNGHFCHCLCMGLIAEPCMLNALILSIKHVSSVLGNASHVRWKAIGKPDQGKFTARTRVTSHKRDALAADAQQSVRKNPRSAYFLCSSLKTALSCWAYCAASCSSPRLSILKDPGSDRSNMVDP